MKYKPALYPGTKLINISVRLWFFLLLISCRKDDVLKGIDKNVLFAPPSPSELQAVKTEWQNRILTPSAFSVEEVHEINKDKLYLHIISFRLHGQRQYAAVIVPVTAKPLPVYIFVYGFALDDPVSYQNIKTSDAVNSDLPFIYVVPALRGQSLSIEATRMKMIASSPMYFYQHLPKTQLHFGKNDKITPAYQGEMLYNKMKESELEDNIEYFIYNNRDHHSIGNNNPEMEERIKSFFEQIL